MNITIIGAPESFGCDRMGTELAPDTLRKKGIKALLESHGHHVTDAGNIPIPKASDNEKLMANSQVKYLPQVVEICTNLAQQVARALEHGSFPLVLGGDHAVALGSLSALGSSPLSGSSLGAVWIDAHGDMNTPSTSPSKNSHGMPMAALMGYGAREMVDLYRPGVKLNHRNVWWVGVRSLDEGEKELIELLDLSVYSMDKIRGLGVDHVAERVKNQIRGLGIKRLHISLDIDSLDPQIAPGTGTPVDGGILLEELFTVLQMLLDTGLVGSMDLVELNPSLDTPDGRTVDLSLKIIDFVAGRLK